jgi:hypothetical protein
MTTRIQNPNIAGTHKAESNTAVAPWRDPGPLMQNIAVAVDSFVKENPWWNHMFQFGLGLVALVVVVGTVLVVRRQWAGK